MRKLVLVTMAVVVAACSLMTKKTPPPRVNVVPILRRNIEVYADAAGNIEPVTITDVKSKASGQIIKLNVEVGTTVRKGDTLVQLDTKEVDLAVSQARYDSTLAAFKLTNDSIDRVRQDSLYAVKAVTKQAYDAGRLTVITSQNALQQKINALDLAKQRQADATVLAPINGTIITRPAAFGAMVQSSTSGTSQGQTLMTMTDLTQLRVKASFNEVDIANIDTGMTATIAVEALGDELIPGRITKIEPVAVNNQSVTMFPVIVSINNRDGRLKPGMNGSVSVWVERRENVVAVPNEAIRQVSEVPFLAQLIESLTGIPTDAESLKAVVDSQVANLGRIGFDVNPTSQVEAGGAPGGAVPPPRGGGGGGDIDMSIANFQGQQGGGRGGQGRGGTGRGNTGRNTQGRTMPTTAQCDPIKSGVSKNAADKKEYDDLIVKLKSPEVDRPATNAALKRLYAKARVDTAMGLRCQMLWAGGFAGGRGGGGGGGGMGGGVGAGGSRTGAEGTGFGANRARTSTKNGLVFVVPSEGVYEARVIKLGLGSYEFTEVTAGLREGENVALLSAAIIALQAQQQRERSQAGMAGNILTGNPAMGKMPGGGGNPGGSRGGGGNPGGGGGGGGGGSGGGRGG